MLKRFMSWLLHRLQKLLSPLSGGRRHTRSPMPSQASSPEGGPVPSSRSSALPLPPHSADSDPERPHQAVAVYEPVTVTLDTSTAAASELIASGALNYLLEVPETEQLPEIHDLLPAIEPEAESDLPARDLAEPAAEAGVEAPAESVETSVNEAPASDDLRSDVSESSVEPSVDYASEEPEILPEKTVADAVGDPPAQAVLFSFDIIESEVAPAAETTDETPEVHSSDSIEKAKDSEDIDSELPLGNRMPTGSAEVTETDQVDIVIEVASPETDDAVETVVASAAQPAEAEGWAEKPDEVIDKDGEDPVKQGVVKLLFTLKQGNYHGYVAPDDGSKDILFHQKYINADIFARVERGSRVVASVKYIEGKAYATRIDLL